MKGINKINSKQQVMTHFLSLSDEDRYNRFGHTIKDDVLERFISHLDMHSNEFWGFLENGKVVALVHLAYFDDAIHCEKAVTLGLSTLTEYRGKHLAQKLFNFAYKHSKEKEVTKIFMSCLAHNDAIKHICRKANMSLQVYQGEIEAVASH